ncbi:MAG TPA: formimidoylglutamase [Pyrinomonadaceae bacterium]|nr:formimidoylglutamase [Pyrinomonadaceae bacterium]
MFDIFESTTRPNGDLFFQKNDRNDVRLGEIVSFLIEDYAAAEIVILGCPQDAGVARNKGRTGAALAPDAIRRQFYKLTDFGTNARIFDLGDTIIRETLEETHEIHTKIVAGILRDDKKIIVLGGGNDISYADGAAMAEIFGAESWSALNIDAHFDVRSDSPRNSGTPYRQLLDECLLNPNNFSEIAFQTQAASKIYFDFLENSGVNLISLDELRNSDLSVRIREILSRTDSQNPIFWGFDVDSVRASDAPGVSAPSPIGLTAEEFCALAKIAGNALNTRMIEFTEVNPNFDIDNRTAKLAAIAMHYFIQA